jgi:hypothetical protein
VSLESGSISDLAAGRGGERGRGRRRRAAAGGNGAVVLGGRRRLDPSEAEKEDFLGFLACFPCAGVWGLGFGGAGGK